VRACSAPPDPLAVFQGPTSKRREGKGGRKGAERGEGGREGNVQGREGERRCMEGFGLPKNLGVAPLSYTCFFMPNFLRICAVVTEL